MKETRNFPFGGLVGRMFYADEYVARDRAERAEREKLHGAALPYPPLQWRDFIRAGIHQCARRTG